VTQDEVTVNGDEQPALLVLLFEVGAISSDENVGRYVGIWEEFLQQLLGDESSALSSRNVVEDLDQRNRCYCWHPR
jgi:hypothetical protein